MTIELNAPAFQAQAAAAEARLEAAKARQNYLMAEENLAGVRLHLEIELIKQVGGEKELGANEAARTRTIGAFLLEDCDYMAALDARNTARLRHDIKEAEARNAVDLAALHRALLGVRL